VATEISNQTILSTGSIDGAMYFLNPLIIKILVALILFALGVILGKLAEKILLKLFWLMDIDKHIARKIGLRFSLAKFLSGAAAYVIFVFLLVMALNQLYLTSKIIMIVVLILTIVVFLFIIFGITDIVANLFAGLVVRIRDNLIMGEHIIVRADKKIIEGKLIGMTLLNVCVDTGRSEPLFIPNMLLFRSEIKTRKNAAK